jgi:hypothetical protein
LDIKNSYKVIEAFNHLIIQTFKQFNIKSSGFNSGKLQRYRQFLKEKEYLRENGLVIGRKYQQVKEFQRLRVGENYTFKIVPNWEMTLQKKQLIFCSKRKYQEPFLVFWWFLKK